ncbi:hypothetical protein V8G54_030559 [Vigna mungo]|uniref:Uncharacterized protein n=1 Tax=Vigna mungo TaxID=3915 RepID=A0AAQ3MWN1_VIGMU
MSPLSASLNTQMNFCLLCSNPIAICWICSSVKAVVVPKDICMTELCSCLSSHSMHECLYPIESFFSMAKGLNGPSAQTFLPPSIRSSNSRKGSSITLLVLYIFPSLNSSNSYCAIMKPTNWAAKHPSKTGNSGTRKPSSGGFPILSQKETKVVKADVLWKV